MRTLPDKLILIDGHCNFCHSTVKWVEKNSKKKDFYYSNIQSELGRELISQFSIPTDVDSVIYIERGKAFTHSAAILKICRHLSFPMSLAVIILVAPAFIRDFVYRTIAKNRYRIFGKKESCELPEVGFNARVLK